MEITINVGKEHIPLLIVFILIFAVLLAINSANISGSFIGEDPNLSLDEKITNCRKMGSVAERSECYEEVFGESVSYGGTSFSLQSLDAYSRQDSEILTYCHPIVHAIGRATFSQEKSVINSFSVCDETCASGCYHGTMEQFLMEKPDFEDSIPTLCLEEVGDTDLYTKFQCLHGLGHGFMFYFGHELFISLEKCDFFKTWWERNSCYGGVFMENIVADVSHPSRFLKRDDPHYPCNAVEEKYKSGCYFVHADWFKEYHNYDFEKAFKECDNSPEEHVWICYKGMGRAVTWYVNHDIIETKKLCDLSSANRRYCIMGVVIDLVNTYNDVDLASQFCRLVEEENKPSCYFQLGEIITVLSQDTQELLNLCSTATEENHVSSCLSGARILT